MSASMLLRTIGSGKCSGRPTRLDWQSMRLEKPCRLYFSVGVLDVGQKLGLMVHEVHPAAQQVAGLERVAAG